MFSNALKLDRDGIKAGLDAEGPQGSYSTEAAQTLSCIPTLTHKAAEEGSAFH